MAKNKGKLMSWDNKNRLSKKMKSSGLNVG